MKHPRMPLSQQFLHLQPAQQGFPVCSSFLFLTLLFLLFPFLLPRIIKTDLRICFQISGESNTSASNNSQKDLPSLHSLSAEKSSLRPRFRRSAARPTLRPLPSRIQRMLLFRYETQDEDPDCGRGRNWSRPRYHPRRGQETRG